MFANLGKIAADSIDKYAEGKKKKEEQDELIKGTKSFIMGNPELGKMLNIQAPDDISYEEAVNQAVPSLVKNPKGFEMIKGIQAMADQRQKAQQATELYNRAVAADKRKIADRQREVNFDRFMAGTGQPSKKAPALIVNPRQFQKRANEMGVDPGLMNNRLMELQKQRIEASKGTGKTMTINDPTTGQNVIVRVNPDGTVGPQVAKAPIQPPRIADPKDVRRGKIDEFQDKEAMQTLSDWKGNARTGQNTIQTVKTMLNTLGDIDTGGFADFKNTLTKYAMSAGVEFTDEQRDKLAKAERFNQLSGEFVFAAISKTKGAVSDNEMGLFKALSPSLVNSPEGNRLMLEYAQKRANRDVELNKEIQGWKKQGLLPQEQVEMAMAWLNDPANDITQDLFQHIGTTTTSSTSPPQAQTNRSGLRGSNPPPNSNAQTVNGFKILKK
jgi:hypothetical protein